MGGNRTKITSRANCYGALLRRERCWPRADECWEEGPEATGLRGLPLGGFQTRQPMSAYQLKVALNVWPVPTMTGWAKTISVRRLACRSCALGD
jgi:hypothetical protein